MDGSEFNCECLWSSKTNLGGAEQLPTRGGALRSIPTKRHVSAASAHVNSDNGESFSGIQTIRLLSFQS
jgi:hypothetical protein